VDSDKPIADSVDGWAALAEIEGCGSRPGAVAQGSAHLMVQVMEAWIAADVDNLERFYGRGFNAKPLGFNPNIENVPKKDVFEGLKSATKDSQRANTTRPFMDST
jgi:hypothetical protein